MQTGQARQRERPGNIMSSKYVQVYNTLKKQIEGGEFSIGEALLPEGELQSQFRVSRDTIRKSLGMLENEGYIQKARGKAAVVVERGKGNFPFAEILSFKELDTQLKRKTETEVENLEILSDPALIMRLFEDDEEKEIYDLLRVRRIGGERVIVDQDYFKRSVVKNLPLRACRDSVYEYLEGELGLEIGYAAKEIVVEETTELDRKYMDLKQYGLVVVVRSYTYTIDNRLFQYTESRHRPDQFKFVEIAQRKRHKII